MTSNAIAGYALADLVRRPQKHNEQRDGYAPRDYTHGAFKDRGCREAPACLTCHLPVCIHDLFQVQTSRRSNKATEAINKHIRSARDTRHAKINHAIEGGLTVKQAADLCGVSHSTARRARRSGAM
jgi:hypothetical protein